jgi:hypothetical protein
MTTIFNEALGATQVVLLVTALATVATMLGWLK